MPTLFHGSPKPVSAFTDCGRGQGFEANSVLGLWLTSRPKKAALYAGQGGVILTVEVPVMRLARVDDWTTAVWGDPTFNQDWRQEAYAMFEAARLDLMAKGFDGVHCEMDSESDLSGAVCVFRPETAVIREATPVAEADALRSDGRGFFINHDEKLEYALARHKPAEVAAFAL